MGLRSPGGYSELLGSGLGKFVLCVVAGLGLNNFLLGVGLLVVGGCLVGTGRLGTNTLLATMLG